jgi:hypothetical protein
MNRHISKYKCNADCDKKIQSIYKEIQQIQGTGLLILRFCCPQFN